MKATHCSFALLLLAAAACGAPPAPAAGVEPAARVVHNPNVISREELQDPAIVSHDANYAVQQLRPAFFRTRGPTSLSRAGSDAASSPGATHISQDFGPLQPVANLTGIDVRSLVEIRYLDAVAATARFGINANGGAVIVLLTSAQ